MAWKDLITWNRKREGKSIPVQHSEPTFDSLPVNRFHSGYLITY